MGVARIALNRFTGLLIAVDVAVAGVALDGSAGVVLAVDGGRGRTRCESAVAAIVAHARQLAVVAVADDVGVAAVVARAVGLILGGPATESAATTVVSRAVDAAFSAIVAVHAATAGVTSGTIHRTMSTFGAGDQSFTRAVCAGHLTIEVIGTGDRLAAVSFGAHENAGVVSAAISSHTFSARRGTAHFTRVFVGTRIARAAVERRRIRRFTPGSGRTCINCASRILGGTGRGVFEGDHACFALGLLCSGCVRLTSGCTRTPIHGVRDAITPTTCGQEKGAEQATPSDRARASET